MATYLITDGDVIEIIFRGRLLGQRIMTTYHYKYRGATVTDGVQAMANILSDIEGGMLFETYSAACPTNYIVEFVSGQVIHPVRMFRQDHAIGTPGLRGTAITANVASVITRKTTVGTRKGRGNIHIPNTALAADVTGGMISPGLGALLESHAVEMLANIPDFDTGELFPILYNRSDPNASRELASCNVQATSRVMRRRTIGVGE